MNSNVEALKKRNTPFKSISIGYLGPKILSPMQIKILSGIQEIIQKHDITLFHFGGPYPNDSQEMISQSSFIFKLLSRKKIDGIIGWSSQLCNEDGYFFNIEGFLDQNPDIPAVFIGKQIGDHPTIRIDNFHGISVIMNHLIQVHNYRKIALISGPEVHPYAVERYKAYVQTLKVNNIAYNPKLVSPPAVFSYKSGIKAICYFLDKQNLKPKKDIEAIVSVSDMFSLPAIEELKDRKINVPRDIAVVGFNNKYESVSSRPFTTTIDVNFEQMGKTAIEVLLTMLNGEKESGIINTPTKLIIRQSCGCMFGDNKLKKSMNTIPVKKDYHSKNKFVKELTRQKDTIITQLNKKLNIKSSDDYKWTETILRGLIDSIKKDSTQIFIRIIENTFELTAEYNIDIFFWNQYFLELREIILEIDVDNYMRSRVEMLFHYAFSALIQQIECNRAYDLLKMVLNEGDKISLFHSIVSTYDLSRLMEILTNGLPALDIAACYLSLFCNPEESIEHASLRLAFNSDNVYQLPEKEIVFESIQLIPAKYYKKIDNILYIILPLYFKDISRGFIVIGFSRLSEFNGFVYDVFRSLVSCALQNIKDMEELKFTQSQLEKKAEEQRIAVLEANEANQAKSHFLAKMSHEIRTPLHCIMGFIDVLKNEKDIKQIDQYINIIESESNKLMELINQLLDLSMIESGTFKIKKIRFNLFHTLETIHSIFYQSTRNKKLYYKTNISEDIPAFLMGDSLRLRQIIINLVGNAVKFTKKGGISISASIQKETDTEITLYFEVTDTGIGITEENQKTIFDPFVQVEDNMTRKFSGTGLGTAISKQLVNLMGGDIRVKSKVGKGSTFWFTIKCRKCSQEEEPVAFKKVVKITDTEKSILKQAVILLVEDYPINRKVATIHLKKLGCKIDSAENGRIAVNMFKNGTYDLILMDIHMPEMDGLEATKKIRSLHGGKQIPIIAMTAIAYEDDIKIFKKNDMDDVVTKPFKKEDLTRTVIYWLTNRKKNNSM